MLLGTIIQNTSRRSLHFNIKSALLSGLKNNLSRFRTISQQQNTLFQHLSQSNLSSNPHSKLMSTSTPHKSDEMPVKLPSHRMAVSPDKSMLVLAISSHLQVFDLTTCKLISSTQNPDLNTKGSNHNALIRLLVIHQDHSSSDGKKSFVLISTGEDKLLKTWELPSLKLINSRELIKRATSIAVSPNGKNIVIADKFGDVYNLPFDAPSQIVFQSDPDQEEPTPAPTAEPSTNSDSKTDPSKPKCKPVLPIAGHVSLLTSLTFIPSQPSPLLVTADRDEHVRISRYPQAWSIFSYLLGHRKFVAALLWVENPLHQQQEKKDDLVKSENILGRLLSAGGDDEIFVWDHLQNLCVKKISVKGLAHGMKVWPHKQTWFSKTRSTKRSRKTLDQSNNNKPNQSSHEEKQDESVPEVVENGQRSQPFVQKTCVNKMICTPPSERAGEGYVLVTSVGSATLAAIPLPCIFDSQTGCLETARYHDVGLPILDIVALSDHHVLLSLDNSFSSASSDPSSSPPSVLFRILTLHPDKIEESTDQTSTNLACLNQLASMEVSTELPMPNQETLYPELVLFTKDDWNTTNQRSQHQVQEQEEVGRGGRSGKKVEGRLLSQKRCEIVLAKSALNHSCSF